MLFWLRDLCDSMFSLENITIKLDIVMSSTMSLKNEVVDRSKLYFSSLEQNFSTSFDMKEDTF
jgi:hypothetical protein